RRGGREPRRETERRKAGGKFEQTHISLPLNAAAIGVAASFARLAGGSVPLEGGPLLCYERFIGAFIVPGLHADRLRLRLGLDGVVDRHAPFLMNAALGHCMREGRAVSERARGVLRLLKQGFRLDQTVGEAPALGLG